MSESVKATREVISYLTPQCDFCGASFGGPGTPQLLENVIFQNLHHTMITDIFAIIMI